MINYENNDINLNNDLVFNKLNEKHKQALANLMSCLNEKQFKLLQKYLKLDEQLKKKEFLNLTKLILSNKKR